MVNCIIQLRVKRRRIYGSSPSFPKYKRRFKTIPSHKLNCRKKKVSPSSKDGQKQVTKTAIQYERKGMKTHEKKMHVVCGGRQKEKKIKRKKLVINATTFVAVILFFLNRYDNTQPVN
jgi:hypothetical protein